MVDWLLRMLGDVFEEMEKDGLELFEQVFVLILGGVLGGQAFQLTQQKYSFATDMLIYTIIAITGFTVLFFIHFFVSLARIQNDENETNESRPRIRTR